jgi:pimeloyl-ACP methyl ester carboxylesterase
MPPTGYNKYRHDFAKLIWKTASPKWNFNDARFDRSAASLNNPDHVSIVIHNYRAPHLGPASYAERFTGKYTHRLIAGGIGHNLPQEAPQAFAEAVVEVDSY